MTYQIILSDDARQTLKKLDTATSKRMIKKLETAARDPFPYLKRLEGVPLFSMRVGDYRLILSLDLDRKTILIIRIGHRKKVYGSL
jgi:mRNA interferase RelE/StbE